MKFFRLLSLAMILFSTEKLKAQEVFTTIGTRIPSEGSPEITADIASPLDKHSPKCSDPTCGGTISETPEPKGGNAQPKGSKEEILKYWQELTKQLLPVLKQIWSAASRVKFDCEAKAVCQSDTQIGATCTVKGLYLTADEAYFKFQHSDCCAMAGLGGQIGVDFKGCSTF